MSVYDWLGLAMAGVLGTGFVLLLRAFARETRRDLRRMLFPLVDVLLTQRDDGTDREHFR